MKPDKENQQKEIVKHTRKRGKALNQAILDAAWETLQDEGYVSMTMDMVAQRAHTNKSTIYRRWDSKFRLVLDSIKQNLTFVPHEVPDTGSLSEDLFWVLKYLVAPLEQIGGETIHGILTDSFAFNFMEKLSKFFHNNHANIIRKHFYPIYDNAESRGDIDRSHISERVLGLPLDLIMYEIMIRQEPICDDVIRTVVDEIIIPALMKDLQK